MALKRITITIPGPLVRATDELATAQERSRSWIVVDALRSYLAGEQLPARPREVRRVEGRAVAEGAASAYGTRPRDAGETWLRAARLGPYRLAQLEADLRLSLHERVRESELAARVAELQTPSLRSERLLMFDRYEDYLEWKRLEERSR